MPRYLSNDRELPRGERMGIEMRYAKTEIPPRGEAIAQFQFQIFLRSAKESDASAYVRAFVNMSKIYLENAYDKRQHKVHISAYRVYASMRFSINKEFPIYFPQR